MVRAGGFEPPTAWFVARYSIQLSYARTDVIYIVSFCLERYFAETKINHRVVIFQNS